MGKVQGIVAVALIVFLFSARSHAAVIDFTGGTATLVGSGSYVTNNATLSSGVDYYVENGFKLDFISVAGDFIGPYYTGGVGNDVIHGHWMPFGTMTAVEITKIGGGPFDLNYFVLTSNTQTGGGHATGLEKAYVEGFSDSLGTVSTGPAVLLPSQDWGFDTTGPFPGVGGVTSVFLGSAFDAVQVVRFYVDNTTNPVFCFGMDEFFIDEPAPSGVPETSSLVTWSLLGTVGVGIVWYRRRNSAVAV